MNTLLDVRSEVYAFIAVALVGQFIDIDDVGVWAHVSGWSRVGRVACLAYTGWRKGSLLGASLNVSENSCLFCGFLGSSRDGWGFHLNPAMSGSGMTLTSKLIFEDCQLGGTIFKAVLGKCFWAGEPVKGIVAVRPESVGRPTDEYSTDISSPEAGRYDLRLVTRFEEAIDSVTVTSSIVDTWDDDAPAADLDIVDFEKRYANLFIAADYTDDDISANSDPDNWVVVNCTMQPTGSDKSDALLVYPTYENQRARQLAFLSAMRGGKVVLGTEVLFSKAIDIALALQATALLM